MRKIEELSKTKYNTRVGHLVFRQARLFKPKPSSCTAICYLTEPKNQRTIWGFRPQINIINEGQHQNGLLHTSFVCFQSSSSSHHVVGGPYGWRLLRLQVWYDQPLRLLMVIYYGLILYQVCVGFHKKPQLTGGYVIFYAFCPLWKLVREQLLILQLVMKLQLPRQLKMMCYSSILLLFIRSCFPIKHPESLGAEQWKRMKKEPDGIYCLWD